MFGLQLGQGLGQLATEVVGATDIGLPLSEPGHVALLPTNIKAFGDGLGAIELRCHALSRAAGMRPATTLRLGRLVASPDAHLG